MKKPGGRKSNCTDSYTVEISIKYRHMYKWMEVQRDSMQETFARRFGIERNGMEKYTELCEEFRKRFADKAELRKAGKK